MDDAIYQKAVDTKADNERHLFCIRNNICPDCGGKLKLRGGLVGFLLMCFPVAPVIDLKCVSCKKFWIDNLYWTGK